MPKRALQDSIEKLQKLRHILRDEISRKYEITNKEHIALERAVRLQMSLHKSMPKKQQKQHVKERKHER